MRTLILFLLAALLAISADAKDDDLIRHLEGKHLVYVGQGNVTKEGVLTFKKEETKYVIDCAVGMALPDETKHYVLFYRNKQAHKLVVYDEKTKKQETLWMKGGT